MIRGWPFKEATAGRHLDLSSVAGLLVAVGGLVGGFLLEQGSLGEIGRLSPFLIVLGGTFGAVLASFPTSQIRHAVARIPDLFFPREDGGFRPLMAEILGYSRTARRRGMLALEDVLESCSDPYLRKGLELAIDGAESSHIRKILELESMVEQEKHEDEARVYESAGGYAPTIGIVGAVLGLILVMKHLDAMDKIGPGIAVAFTATIYGVASANLVFLPFAKKIRARARLRMKRDEFVLQGVCGIAEGLHPRTIERILEAFCPRRSRQPGESPGQALASAAGSSSS